MNIYLKFMVFCVVGGLGLLTELFVFNILFSLEVIFSVSKILGMASSLTIIFLLNRNFTFSASDGKIKYQASKYIIVYALAIMVNFSSSVLFNWLFPEGRIYANAAVLLGIALSIPISFSGSLLWVFKE